MGKKLLAATDTLIETALIYLVILLIAATAFSYVEGRSFIDSLYWAGVTGPGVGYGDVTPQTAGGKVLAVVFAHISLFLIIPMFVTRLVIKATKSEHDFTHEEQQHIIQLLQEIKDK